MKKINSITDLMKLSTEEIEDFDEQIELILEKHDRLLKRRFLLEDQLPYAS